MLRIEKLEAKINQLSEVAVQKRHYLNNSITAAQQWLARAPSLSDLERQLAPLHNSSVDWSGAWPIQDKPWDRYTSADRPPPGTVLIAVDGSQIFPDRHAAVLYYVIQVGGIVFCYNGNTPRLYGNAEVYFEDSDIYDDNGYPVSAEKVNVQRQVQEMTYLAQLASEERKPASESPYFALTDGPLLWPYPERGNKDALAMQTYLDALSAMQHVGVVPVGYVDRPGGRALLDLLWVSQLAAQEVVDKRHDNPLKFLADRDLMSKILAPGERSAWYTRSTLANQRHRRMGQEICFCYINLGENGRPNIARLEVPVWAINDDSAIQSLHAALHHQVFALNGYPYVLARAHEEALITTQDKATLDSILQQRLVAKGMLVQLSEKARQKSYLGRR